MSNDAPDVTAGRLAERLRPVPGPAPPMPLWDRVADLGPWAASAREALAGRDGAAAKAAEWLFDNEYLIVRAVRQVRRDLPRGFYDRLPATGDADRAQPRVWLIARALLEASHLQLSLPTVTRFVEAYQARTPLLSAELWALPTFLRLGCLELLAGSVGRLAADRPPPFAVEPLPGLALDETECVGRAISNLRVISEIPWKDFFCRTSRLEAALGADPAGTYPAMDFETRDRYRREVEGLSRACPLSELEVAHRLIARAREAGQASPRRAHVGYWLVDEGRPAFERQLGCRVSWRRRAWRFAFKHAGPIYALALATATAAAIAAPAGYVVAIGGSPAQVALTVALTLLPALTLAMTVVHWLVTVAVAPRLLPKMDFESGIPDTSRVAVVMPTLVGSPAEARRHAAQLERHYLANPVPGTRFVLLTDFPDAPAERQPGDEKVTAALTAAVADLNRRHASRPFHVLHRPRRFNPAEGVWMGWERKRGKLDEFLRWLGGDGRVAYAEQVGCRSDLEGIRYAITVDADTLLPRGAVARLAGTAAHPLNRPEFDEQTGRVRAGYTVIQPRVEITPEAGNRSRFARLFAGDTAIDIYSRAVSDVYQDLFGAGIYVGKGLLDVAAFRRSLDGRVPENALASHDLFEGIHGRTALATDVVVYEDFPRQYLEFARRLHRWVRGDWQLLPWLWFSVPAAGGRRRPNRLRGIDRWKIVDNLRRSLLPPALMTMLVAGWLVLPGHPGVWTALGVLAPAGHLFTDLVTGLSRGRRRSAVSTLLQRSSDQAGRWLLLLVFLPHDAVLTLDAIGRALVRMAVTRRHLLEWTTAAATAATLGRRGSRGFVWRAMWTSPSAAIGWAIVVLLVDPAAGLWAGPLLAAWLVAPEIAHQLGRPRRTLLAPLSRGDRLRLRRLARRTWRYFEVFAGPEDQWLPPDNFQEEPGGEVAHRTSPTNIGMLCLSSLAAHDLGYVGVVELTSRLDRTLATLEQLDRHRGHFLNWYDTRSLEPLQPRYVSTVDSGNLGLSLVALAHGCRDIAAGPAVPARRWDGLQDTFGVLAEVVGRLGVARSHEALRDAFDAFAARVQTHRDRPERWWATLDNLHRHDAVAVDRELIAAIERSRGGADLAGLREVRIWLERVHHQLRAGLREFDVLCPWLALATDAPASCRTVADELIVRLPPGTPLADLAERVGRVAAWLEAIPRARCPDDGWRAATAQALERGRVEAAAVRARLLALADRAEALAWSMDFGMLYDRESRLFHIGYNVNAARLDAHHYDLLASEARLASLFAIAKGDVPVEHWFHLGRPTTRAVGGQCLISWGGSMFEYLMPDLLLRSEAGTLVAESAVAAVRTQRRYGDARGVPWGMSESGFAVTDAEHVYQYHSFGVPTLSLRRGGAGDLVVAPYASVLALAVDPPAAVANLRRLERLGLVGDFGFYEAADFTPDRRAPDQPFVPVRSYMAHHQGMILAALDNALAGDVLVARVSADPRIRAVSLLLHERVPVGLVPEHLGVEAEAPRPDVRAGPEVEPWMPRRGGRLPLLHVLGNGRLASWISDSGAGAVRWRDWQLTRWAPDPTVDDTGLWIYVDDVETGDRRSVTRQPTGAPPEAVDVICYPHLVEFDRRVGDLGIRTEIVVTPADDVEIRRVTLVNDGERSRRLALTSCGEVVLARAADHERHPAFSRLFVATEFLPGLNGLLCTRRPRSPTEQPPVLCHWVIGDDRLQGIAHETDRGRFLGRLADYRRPRGVTDQAGPETRFPLDPVIALRAVLEVPPGGTARVAFATAAAGSPEWARELAARYHSLGAIDWAMADAATEVGRRLHGLGIDARRLAALQPVCSALAYRARARGGNDRARVGNRLGQPQLWGLGLSGDLPILLVWTSREASDFIGELIGAHEWWRRCGLLADFVVLHRGLSGYDADVHHALRQALAEIGLQDRLGARGGVHLLHADQVAPDIVRLLEAAAHVVLEDDEETLARRLASLVEPARELPAFPASAVEADLPPLERPAGLLFDNGTGGFSADGREYVIHLEPGQATPAPWANVLANPGFGTLVTEAGGGFTWSGNSAERRLTPWSNDPVQDLPGEVVYLRDEETGDVWTPTPMPAGAGPCQVRHGAGYTAWESRAPGLSLQLEALVDVDDPVKVVRLRLRNHRPRPRRITATCYVEWVLGASRDRSSLVATEFEPAGRALLARNPWAPEFGGRVAFLTADREPHGVTTDRTEFLGRDGTRRRPAALERWGLTGAAHGDDPCGAYQVHLDLGPNAEESVTFVIGEGRDRRHTLDLVDRWRRPDVAVDARARVDGFWNARLGVVHVETPDAAANLLLNRWLLYQALSARLLGRTGFYQSSGAVGFRDQLQDTLAFLLVEPGRCRAHLLECAAHQFAEGDVLHWWHPPGTRGVRTRCSDDLLWLPFATARYVEATGDAAILDERVPFLLGRRLEDQESDLYTTFERSDHQATLFEHCERALEQAATEGAHGLPLIGSGDWNDGMNRVGDAGRGESVWLAWFAAATMRAFATLCDGRGAAELGERWRDRARRYAGAVEGAAWDGLWYQRAFDDDGHPLGSQTQEECQIDSIAQSWAVLSALAAPDRSARAIEAVEARLIDPDHRLVRLLAPPFDRAPGDPGYIKAYPPGIRENGGQYTHAAVWVGWALADLAEGARAFRIFDLLNPIRQATDPDSVRRYRTEPYVVAADVSGRAPHLGRGGWTWYTGAAAWLWRLGTERLVGLQPDAGGLRIDPCLPPMWHQVRARVTRPGGTLEITIDNPAGVSTGVAACELDGRPAPGGWVPLPSDGGTHELRVRLGRPASPHEPTPAADRTLGA